MANSATLGSADNPLRVAIVGSGPSGFYAAEALLRSDLEVRVDLFERLPAPFGLVRNGVAPDHPKLKEPILVYQKIAEAPELNLIANVTVGRDLSIEELRNSHHAVIFTCGAETDRRLGIPGEDLPGSHTATAFVGWYNGHPDYRDWHFDLSHPIAVIVGQGNVAADVCRVLAKTVDELKHTDITEHALDALAESHVREIHIIGRRGPLQAKFTNKELRELGKLENCDALVSESALALNPESEQELEDRRSRASTKNLEIFRGFIGAESGKPRKCHFHFLQSPVELLGEERLEAVVLGQNRLSGAPFEQQAEDTGERSSLECGLLFRSIGYRGVPIQGVPFDPRRGVIPNREGRVVGEHGKSLPGLYVSGWIKRGPSGIIGTNRADSVETVKSLLADVAQLDATPRPGAKALYPLLSERQVRHLDYASWQRIDASEVSRGEPKGKPREKFTRVAEMLAAVQ